MKQFSLFVLILLNASTLAAQNVSSSELNKAALIDKYNQVSLKLHGDSFPIPVVIESSKKGKNLKGEIIGIIKHPFNAVTQAFKTPSVWCDILLLHLNIKACTFTQDGKKLNV